jgi:hypothetical protein
MQDILQDVTTSGGSQENANQQSPNSNNEVKTLMDLAFIEQSSPAEREALQQQLSGTQPEAAATTDPAGATPAETSPAPKSETSVFDESAYLKEFGFESKDALKAALEAQNQQVVQNEPTFANETSKKIYEALVAGNTKEVKEFLDLQHATENLDAMSPEQQIKLHIKHQYPDLTQTQIDRVYAKKYAVKEESEYDDPIDYQIAQQMMQSDIKNDAVKAKTFFNDYRTKIELPQTQSIQSVDADYEAWKASNAQATDRYNTETLPVINAIKEGDLASSFKINDPNNQLDIEISHVVEPSDLATAKQHALNYGQYMQQFYTAEGKLNGTRLMQAILRDMLFDKYVQTTARQAVNAERKRLIEKETPTSTLQRNGLEAVEKSEFQKMMDMAMNV